MAGPEGSESMHSSSVLWKFYKPWRRNRKNAFYGLEGEEGSTDAGHLSDTEIMKRGGRLTDAPDSPRENEDDRQSSPESAFSSARVLPRRRKYDPRRYVGRSTVYASMGSPPRGYLWVWLGHFKRWHRRFFILTTPGVFVYAKRPDMKGGEWTINLKSASVVVGRGNVRQFCLVTANRVVYLRTLARGDREMWVSYLRRSISKYDELVERTRGFAKQVKGLEERHSYSLEVDPEMQSFQRDLWVRMYAKATLLRPSRDVLEQHLRGLNETVSKISTLLGVENPDPENSLNSRLSGSQPHPSQSEEAGEIFACPQQSFGPRASGSYPSSGVEHSQTLTSTNPGLTSSVWTSYNNFLNSVDQALKDEVVKVLELQAENSALRKLLRDRDRQAGPNRHGGSLKEIPHTLIQENELSLARGGVPVQGTSLATSGTYSTADSEFNDDNSETSDQDGEDLLGAQPSGSGKSGATPLDSPTRAVVDDELIRALEVVRRVEYATRGKPNAEFEEEGEGQEPPADGMEEDDPEDEDNGSGGREDSEVSSPTGSVRSRLPCPRPLRRGFSIWSILKNAIGRDLTRITLPATINEPLSALQRVAEEFEYYSLLEKAAECDDPQQRLVYVVAFALSSYASGLPRDNKPFNPLLGETFEWQDDGIRLLAEQVSHHPPVSCFNARGVSANGGEPSFEVHGELELRSKFWGKSLYVYPTGRCELFLSARKEWYVWNKSNISIHNIIIGRLWLDFYGEVVVTNRTSGACATINLPKCGGYMDRRGKVEGSVKDSAGEVSHTVSGNFRSVISAVDVRSGSSDGEEAREVFRCNEPPEDSEEQYNMTKFAIGLNDVRRVGMSQLARTDARFRPDVRALENGEFEVATSEKLRLEEKQRHTRRVRKEAGLKYSPVWFGLRDESDKELVKTMGWKGRSAWDFRSEYWKKDANELELSPDIFSESVWSP
ncbi:hypothetical protein BSKO_03292 [Bryopsis sp. KO-2023]|nr:hypothetical protein BSKO_03292 [Bryopsis sp. KO-2023]